MQGVDEDLADEVLRALLGAGRGERQDEHGVDVLVGQQLEAMIERGQGGWRAVGCDDGHRVRVESDHDRHGPDLARVPDHAGDDVPVASVDAVEDADGRDRPFDVVYLVQRTPDLHSCLLQMTAAQE